MILSLFVSDWETQRPEEEGRLPRSELRQEPK